MATDIRGLYTNNRRREMNAVTLQLPYVMEDADLREGTAVVNSAAGDYTALTLPDGVLVKSITLIVSTGEEYAGAATVAATIGGTSVLAATTIAAAGVTESTTNLPLVTEGDADVVLTLAAVEASSDIANIKVVVEYIDYARATMSYIGEK